jgi:thioredoxin-dependent peroxiredoxin
MAGHPEILIAENLNIPGAGLKEQTMLKIGQEAPDFKLKSDTGSEVSLKDFKGKRVVVYFYPRASTPGCTVEACEFRDLRPKFEKQNVVVLGVSGDQQEALVRFKKKQNLNFTLLSDPDHKMIKEYGVWRMKKFMGRSFKGIVRSTFLIGPDGKIEEIWDAVSAKGHAGDVFEKVAE